MVLDPIITALQDDDDDVRALAASALLPVIEAVVMLAPNKVKNIAFFINNYIYKLYIFNPLTSYKFKRSFHNLGVKYQFGYNVLN